MFPMIFECLRKRSAFKPEFPGFLNFLQAASGDEPKSKSVQCRGLLAHHFFPGRECGLKAAPDRFLGAQPVLALVSPHYVNS
jgi:hypothetical protein